MVKVVVWIVFITGYWSSLVAMVVYVYKQEQQVVAVTGSIQTRASEKQPICLAPEYQQKIQIFLTTFNWRLRCQKVFREMTLEILSELIKIYEKQLKIHSCLGIEKFYERVKMPLESREIFIDKLLWTVVHKTLCEEFHELDALDEFMIKNAQGSNDNFQSWFNTWEVIRETIVQQTRHRMTRNGQTPSWQGLKICFIMTPFVSLVSRDYTAWVKRWGDIRTPQTVETLLQTIVNYLETLNTQIEKLPQPAS